MNTTRHKVAKNRGLKYFSQLTPKQKDKAHLKVCEILANKNPNYIHPNLWNILFDIAFEEIIKTKKEADKYTKGYCFKHKGIYIPLKITNIHNKKHI